MATAFVHIGMDKTGTTYLQGVCAAARALLLQDGLDYPEARGVRASHHVDFAAAHGFSWNFESTDAHSDDAWSAMASPEPEAGRTLLLSSEHFCYNATPTTVGRLKRWLLAHGYDDVRIVVYLRDQVGWLISAYAESIKWGNKSPLDVYYTSQVARLTYSTMLATWAAEFGMDRMIVANYDLARPDLLRHFLRLVGAREETVVQALALPPRADNSFSCQLLLESIRRMKFEIANLDLYGFIAQTYSKVKTTYLKSIYTARIWRLPKAFLDAASGYDDDNVAIARSYHMTPLAALAPAMQAYQDKVVDMTDAEMMFAAGLLMLETSTRGPAAAKPK